LEVGFAAADAWHQNRELAAAEAGDLIAFPHRTHKVSRDIREDFVPSSMSVTVVDRLETVQIVTIKTRPVSSRLARARTRRKIKCRLRVFNSPVTRLVVNN
jgi:hypothetical protein